jgi:hypothetical protein
VVCKGGRFVTRRPFWIYSRAEQSRKGVISEGLIDAMRHLQSPRRPRRPCILR